MVSRFFPKECKCFKKKLPPSGPVHFELKFKSISWRNSETPLSSAINELYIERIDFILTGASSVLK
jgi:hypothetical protein